MRFQVPQFINVEDKIFGALSAKQFIYLAGGGGLTYILLKFLPNFIAIILSIPIIVLAISLAFVKINRKPFIFTLEYAFKYLVSNKLYVWKKDKKQNKENVNQNQSQNEEVFAPKLSDSKLKDLSWSLDINKGVEKPQK